MRLRNTGVVAEGDEDRDGGFKWEAVGLYEVLTTCGLPRRENTERAFSAESRHIPSENKSLGKLPWLILGERTNDHKRAFPNTFRDLAFAISAPLLFHCYIFRLAKRPFRLRELAHGPMKL
ncbi:hypothetical protein KQX54_008252 [Cotesia glomerata]|uniref:Uncharacterized protein n=1 Tax=Cotesia glomerata TaxID=32391 RepID=A0AAV7IR49_COTGL|nr:hypothetical protein KQX54_008252 [Cotesia glomerata]